MAGKCYSMAGMSHDTFETVFLVGIMNLKPQVISSLGCNNCHFSFFYDFQDDSWLWFVMCRFVIFTSMFCFTWCVLFLIIPAATVTFFLHYSYYFPVNFNSHLQDSLAPKQQLACNQVSFALNSFNGVDSLSDVVI